MLPGTKRSLGLRGLVGTAVAAEDVEASSVFVFFLPGDAVESLPGTSFWH